MRLKQAQASGNTVLRKKNVFSRMLAQWDLQILLVPGILLVLLFSYVPMYGVVMGFQDFQLGDFPGFSQWVGFKHFQTMFADKYFGLAMRNTLVISALKMFIGFPLPIFFAVLLNEMNFQPLKKTVQTVSYLPHFISTVVMAGMLILFLSPSTGIIAKLVGLLGFKLPNLMGSAKAFPHIYVWSEAWQHVGWDSILYIATLSSVDPTLYEAATMDGANKWHKMIHIDVPALLPTATIMFIMRMGSVMSVGFEKVYLLQNTLNSTSSEIISTYVYKMGLVSSQYSLSAAIGLFNNIINLVLLLAVNFLSSKMSDTSLI